MIRNCPTAISTRGDSLTNIRHGNVASILDSARELGIRDAQAELAERSFAHLYETGGMRRTHLRGHDNILKRLLMHGGGFNLGLAMRQHLGIGTPRRLQGRAAGVLAVFIAGWARLGALWGNHEPRFVDRSPRSSPRHCFERLPVAA